MMDEVPKENMVSVNFLRALFTLLISWPLKLELRGCP